MNYLTRIFFCIFTLTIFYSCEPEEIPAKPESTIKNTRDFDKMGDTGDQSNEVDVDKK